MKIQIPAVYKKLLVFSLLLLFWSIPHEGLHYSVCRLSGCEGKLYINFINSRVECLEIVSKPVMTQYIYYAIPHMGDLIIILFFIVAMLRKVNVNRYIRLIPYAAFLDVLVNYLSFLEYNSDFYNIIVLSKNTSLPIFHLSLVIVISTILATYFYFKKNDYEPVKKFITKTFQGQ